MQSKALILPGAMVLITVVLILGNMNLLPESITNLWPIILIVAGLIGLTSYEVEEKPKLRTVKVAHSTKPVAKKTATKLVKKAPAKTAKKVKKTSKVKKSKK